jgi:hypothetical protein
MAILCNICPKKKECVFSKIPFESQYEKKLTEAKNRKDKKNEMRYQMLRDNEYHDFRINCETLMMEAKNANKGRTDGTP